MTPRISRLTSFVFILLIIAAAGAVMAQEKAAGEPQEQQAIAPAATQFEGTVVLGLGNYFYLPSAKGYDIYVQGTIQGQDASSLTGKEVRVKGAMLKEEPSIFAADSIEIKDAAGQYQSVFTRTEDVKLVDHVDTTERAAFTVLVLTKADKSEDWEGKGKAKVHGKLVDNSIVVSDDKGKEVGKILVDTTTVFSKYYIQKLKLFDKFWFYINIKDTVDAKVRRKTRELFHADMVFAGLF